MEIKENLVVILPMLLGAMLLIGYSATSPSTFNLRVSKDTAINLKAVKVEVLDPTTCTATTTAVLSGTDVTSFLKEPSGNSKPGKADYSTVHNEYVYYFETSTAKSIFDAAPEVYIPQYGGFSAWEVAKSCAYNSEADCLTISSFTVGKSSCVAGLGPECSIDSASRIDTSLSFVDGDRNTANHKLYLFADEDTKTSFVANSKLLIAKADANWLAHSSKMNTLC